MDVGYLKKQIKLNTLEPFYIMTGEEIEIQNIYIAKMAEVSGTQVTRIDSISEIFKRQGSLFSAPKCYVCRDDKDFIKTEKAWDNVTQALGKNMLIMLWTTVDKRTKFYKHFEDKLLTFNLQDDEFLHKYVLKKIKLNTHNCLELIHICENNYGRILLEIDKIKCYMEATGKNEDTAFTDLVKDGAIYLPPQDAIFRFCDAVLFRRQQEAFDLLEQCNKIGEPALRLVTVLYTNVKKQLIVQSCTSNDVMKSTGLSYWEVKTARDKLNRWSIGELVYVLKLLRQLERGIKIGTIDESIVMDYFMVNIF